MEGHDDVTTLPADLPNENAEEVVAWLRSHPL
jgi:hypothetical protein